MVTPGQGASPGATPRQRPLASPQPPGAGPLSDEKPEAGEAAWPAFLPQEPGWNPHLGLGSGGALIRLKCPGHFRPGGRPGWLCASPPRSL